MPIETVPTQAVGGASGPKLSACIISFNEEANIARCIDSVSWCDEVVVVDSFSQDRTARIARERGARVVQAPWPGHVAQKNRAVDEARGEWIFSIDCDEEVTPRLKEAVLAAVRSPEPADGYFVSRKLCYLGRWLGHGGWFPEWRIRLFRKAAGRWAGVDPHDTVQVGGRTERIPTGGRGIDAAVILHRSFRDLSHQLQVLDRYTDIQAGELARAGGRAGPVRLLLRPAWRFIWSYFLRLGFLDGAPGFHMAFNHAYAAYMKYAKLWEIRKGLVVPRAKGDLVPGGSGSTAQIAPGSSKGPVTG